MPKLGFFSSAITAGAALAVLAFAGIFMLMIFAVYAGIAAVIALVPVIIVDARKEWGVTDESPTFLVPLQFAFFISGAVAFALDLIFKTYVSIPAMIDALDLTHWVAARPQPLIQSVPDYYAFVLGPTPLTWLRFGAHYLVMVLIFAFVLSRVPREVELEPVSPMTRNVRLLGLSAVAVATVAVTLFPLTTWAMIGVRNLNH